MKIQPRNARVTGNVFIPLDPHTDTDTSRRAAGSIRIVVLGTSMSMRDLGQGQR